MGDGDFLSDGYEIVRGALSMAACRAILAEREAGVVGSLDWVKGHAATSRRIYEASIEPRLLDRVTDLLGPNVVLWGASIVARGPGSVHAPHVDIETAREDVRSVSVWVGLHNVVPESTLQLITGSHRLGKTVQQVAHERDRRRGDFTLSDALLWSAEADPDAVLATPDVTVGDAILFDGSLWHGSDNRSDATRQALLLQFATAESPIRIPDLTSFEWPLEYLESPRPPCIVVAGEATGDANRIVAPPRPMTTSSVVTGWARELPRAPADDHDGWSPYHLMQRATTANVDHLWCHMSFLDPDISPHPPHRHDEEEALVVLSGMAILEWVDPDGTTKGRPVGPGAVAYYPAGHAHTIRGVGDEPAGYLMLKWRSPATGSERALEPALFDAGTIEMTGDSGFRASPLFTGPTGYLPRFHGHVTHLDPGAGYAPHVDAHDVAIVLLDGTVTSLGVQVTAPAVVFSSGGEPLDMLNTGAGMAKYVVFEFHGARPAVRAAADPKSQQPIEDAVSTTPPSTTDPAPGVARHRGWARVWARGGRALERFPRLRRGVKRALRPLSPWGRR